MNHIKERIGILYKISNDINSKVYIGKTYNTLENRWRLHISDSKKEKRKTRPLYNAMNKYGIEHFKIEELGKYKNGELEKQEILHIEKYDSYYNGYNATMGGDGQLYGDNVDKIFSEEQQKQIIKWFYEYPNISFLSKELNIHYKQLGKILNKYNIKKLKQKPLKIAENSMRIYQIEK